MPLSLDTREVGRVTVVQCIGRIVAGNESDALRTHVTWLLRDRRSIVLDLHQVKFIDSSGLGTMVRALTTTRQAHGDLKLCNVPDFVRKVLEISRLTAVFDLHESEERAVAAFYRPGARAEQCLPTGGDVLCVDSSPDVLAYLRELLRRAGYGVQSSSRVSDATLLMRVSRFDLLLVGADMAPSPASPPAFREACAKLPVIELGRQFSTQHAGDAAAQLLESIANRLRNQTRQ